MDKPAVIRAWIRQIEAALQTADWAALARVDRAVASGLPRLLAEGAWGSADRCAYLQLQAMHREALSAVALARSELGHRLGGLDQERQAWLSYAEAQARESLP